MIFDRFVMTKRRENDGVLRSSGLAPVEIQAFPQPPFFFASSLRHEL
jgi:hypothetical protein